MGCCGSEEINEHDLDARRKKQPKGMSGEAFKASYIDSEVDESIFDRVNVKVKHVLDNLGHFDIPEPKRDKVSVEE